MKATVVVPTHNRAADLERLCRTLVADLSPSEVEVLLVDNGSGPQHLVMAERLAGQSPELIRLVREPRVGVNHARNRAIAEARGELVVFLDDDAVPEPSWFAAFCDALTRPGVLVAGGPISLELEGPPPTWFTPAFRPYLSAWDLGPDARELTYNEYPRGANLGYRRETFARFGLFSPRLDRTGRSLRSCGDIEHCLRVERGGGKILYHPGARVRHVQQSERLTVAWMRRRFQAQGFSEALVEWRHGGWPALRWGLGRLRRAPVGLEPLVRDCLRLGRRSYALGALAAPLLIRRYRWDATGRRLARWCPRV